MDITLVLILIGMVGLLCVLVFAVLVLQLRKPNNDKTDVSTPLQNLTQAVHDVRVQTASLTADIKARSNIEKQTADSIARLETIIAGSGSKGAAGERVLENLISKLPTEWQVQNFRVGNKPVEFGLRLSNGLILPIDSKWAATNLLEQFSISTDLDEQRKLREQIEKIVINKAKEVQKYIDSNLTMPFGIAVIPDAIYDICPTVNIETNKYHVIVVSYSMFLPYLLLVFHTVLTTSRTIDMEKLSASIQAVHNSISAVESELENRYSKAVAMLEISRRELKGHIGKANNALTSIQITSNQSGAIPPESPDSNS